MYKTHYIVLQTIQSLLKSYKLSAFDYQAGILMDFLYATNSMSMSQTFPIKNQSQESTGFN